jgi:phosphoribulokinase
MSQRHPIIAVTGSSGAGTTTVKDTLDFLKFKPSVEYKLHLKGLIEEAKITTYNTLVIPGGKMMYAMELILTKLIIDLLEKRGQMHDAAI